MAVLSIGSQSTGRHVRGREKRNITLNTKLTRAEYAEVERFCEAHGFGFGEWVRSLVLREIRSINGPTASPSLLGEITGLRLLLINTLEPLLRGEKMSPEQFKAMLQYVKNNKRKAAADTLASYAEGGGDRL